jgi:predicted DNA-binding protein YlxM (UPF0122 family)
MKKSYNLVVYDISENLGRIEELCMDMSFYFSKIYDIEKDFCKRTKYSNISKQVVFLTIQRSNSMIIEIMHKMNMLESNKRIVDEQLKSSILEIQNMIKSIEKNYDQRNYGGMIKQLEDIGNKSATLKNRFKKWCIQ